MIKKLLEEGETLKCQNCKTQNNDENNFCFNCGTKLRKECNCWVKKEPYNCERGKCPGYRLYKKIIQEK